LGILPTPLNVGKFANMRGPRAELILKERFQLREDLFAEVVIWRVPEPVRGSTHMFKYRLALVENNVCLVRYDNEAGKGDHKHIGDDEVDYVFAGLDALQFDFSADIERRLKR
jgi:hypothetical protein